MKQIAQNTFNNGLRMDLNPLTTPNNVLTDCLNGTIITYNGNEFTLQNDMGNCQVDSARLSPGFIPMGMKEYGGIIYVVSLNPITGDCEVGSFPSPQRDFTTTDFDNLSPVRFQTSEFVLETNTTHEMSTKFVGKLFEPELFELHPGDKYVVVYVINTPPGGSGVPIIDQASMDAYISGNPAARKLFALNFYKISDSNNLVAIPSGTIKYIKDLSDIDNEYVYYPEPANSVLAVALELEQLDQFDATVVDSSLRTSSDKKVGIQAIGYSNSLSDFQGIKVDITLPSVLTFYLDKGSNSTKKVSGSIDGLAAQDQFECSITPYSKYNLFPKLTKKYKLTLGSYFSSGSGVNDVFQYYLDPAYVRVDFDFKFQGNDPNGLHLYVEFYDPWSDYSIIKTVDNPTYYGLNSVIVETIDEPRIDQFDSTTVGGTLPSKLKVNADTIYEKSLLNSTNMIRTDQFLRKNHFYIVRISGIDTDTSTGTAVYTHYDLYKGLYTTTMYNDIYTGQAALSSSDPSYVSDFNALDFDISSIGYQTTVGAATTVTQPTVSSDFPQTMVDGNITYPLMTDNQYYKIDESALTGTYKNTQTFEIDTTYDVALTLTGTDQVFGVFRNNLLTSTFPTLIASDAGGSGVKPTIVEQVVPNTPTTNSRADWTVVQNTSVDYTVRTLATTTRNITAPVTSSTANGKSYKEFSILPSFYYYPNSNGPLTNPLATIELHPQSGQMVDISGAVQHVDNSAGVQSEDLYNLSNSMGRHYSGWWGCCFDRDVFLHWDGAPGDYGCTSGCTDTAHRHNMLFLRNATTGQIAGCRTHDINVAVDFFTKLKVASNVDKLLHLNYPNTNLTIYNGQLTSTFQFTGAVITTNFTPNGTVGNYTKTYLSDFRLHATGAYAEFDPTILNNYIASRQSTSTIVDGKNTIRDGFIPYITTPSVTTSPLVLNDIIISQSCDSTALGKFRNAQTIGLQDATFTSGGSFKPHGTLFSSDPNGLYQEYVSKFGVGVGDHGPITGVEIDPTDLHIYINNASVGWPTSGWAGYSAGNGNPFKYHAPNLFADFQIS